jgi:hypothetical protein
LRRWLKILRVDKKLQAKEVFKVSKKNHYSRDPSKIRRKPIPAPLGFQLAPPLLERTPECQSQSEGVGFY